MKSNHIKWLSWTVLLLSILSLTVCGSDMNSCTWNQHLGNPGRTAYTACDGPDAPEVLWRTSLTGEIDTPPLVVGDALIVLKKNSVSLSRFDQSSLIRMNLYTGKITGRIDSEEGYPYTRFFSDGTNIYLIGSSPQYEQRFEIWRVDFEENELVSMASIRGYYWSWHHSLALVLDDRIIYPSFPLTGFSKPDFNILWSADEFPFGCERADLLFVAADESHLYVVMKLDDTEKIYALDKDIGEIVWLRELPGKVRVLAVEHTILFVGGDHIHAIDTDTGRTLWRFTPEGWVFANLVIGSDYVFASDSANQIYALDKARGRLVWQTELGGDPGWTSLAGGGQFLYCTRGPGERSKIVCFLTKDGTKPWEYMLPSETRTCPALTNGILILTLLRGEIYAFSANPDSEDAGITDEPEVTPPPSKPESTPSTAPESSPPDTQPPTEPPSQTPPASTEPEPLQFPKWYLVVAAGVIIVLITYVLQEKK